MKISRHFVWEAAHRHLYRAPRDLHRHAYRLTVELEGVQEEWNGFETIEPVLRRLVETWRDAVLVAAEDQRLQREVHTGGQKHVVLPGGTTAEHLSQYVVDYFCMMAAPELRGAGVEVVQVSLEEDAAGETDEQASHRACARAYLRAKRYGSLKSQTASQAAA